MPEHILRCGRSVQVDWEDLEWIQSRTWRAWKKHPDGPAIVVRDEMYKMRSYRVRLLRELAVRMRPELVSASHRMRVKPFNGDPFDARRSNLDITIRPAVSTVKGIAAKPKGSMPAGCRGRRIAAARKPSKASSPLWQGGRRNG